MNVSSGIVDGPGPIVGLNAYATTMAALEAHSINLAAELADSGVTVNVYRPGSVEAAMRAWFGSYPAVQRGTDLELGAAPTQYGLVFQRTQSQSRLVVVLIAVNEPRSRGPPFHPFPKALTGPRAEGATLGGPIKTRGAPPRVVPRHRRSHLARMARSHRGRDHRLSRREVVRQAPSQH